MDDLTNVVAIEQTNLRKWNMPYSDAKRILQEKFNATEQEIVRWMLDEEITPKGMWDTTTVGGMDRKVCMYGIESYEYDGEMYRLQSLDFNADEINHFVPKNRWLTFNQVMERWPESDECLRKQQLCVAEKLKKLLSAPTILEIDNGSNLNLYVYPLDVIENVLPLPKPLKDFQKSLSEQQSETVENDGACSQADIEPSSAKIIQTHSNDTKFSGLLNVLGKTDNWFDAIDDMTRAFYSEYGKMPNEFQAWAQLWTNPPSGYFITTGKDRGDDCLIMPGFSNNLNKKSFNERWKKYTAPKAG